MAAKQYKIYTLTSTDGGKNYSVPEDVQGWNFCVLTGQMYNRPGAYVNISNDGKTFQGNDGVVFTVSKSGTKITINNTAIKNTFKVLFYK